MASWVECTKLTCRALAFGVLALSLLIPAAVWAQVPTGATLSGTATDASGAGVPGAQITITNMGTDSSSVTTTSGAGFYAMANLPSGSYQVSASAAGFSTSVQTGVTLVVGGEQTLNFTLQVGEVSQRIEVTSSAPTVELTSSSIGATITPQTVVDLPLNGRDWTTLATLQPGVSLAVTQTNNLGINSGRAHEGFGQELAIAGTRPELNSYRLDGISIVDQSNGAPGSVLGVALGTDAIAEFSVVTSNTSAEYGRTSGGVVNAVTKSGTNAFHGSGYEFLRNDDLDARGFFDKSKLAFRRNQFGGSLGGPIQKDKTFFFGDYEGTREFNTITNIATVLSQNARNGILSTGDVTVNPQIQPFLAFWPLPNAGLLGAGDTGHFDVALPNPSHENFATGRVDHIFSPTDTLFGMYRYDQGFISEPDGLQNIVYANLSRENTVAVAENHTFSSTLINSVRVGYHRSATAGAQAIQALNPLALSTSATYSTFPGQQWAPEIAVSGLTAFDGGMYGISAPIHDWNSYQISEDVFLTKGAHSIKIGFSGERDLDNSDSPAGPNGQFNFGSISAFLTNGTVNWQDTYFPSVSWMYMRQNIIGGYVQDDWRFRRRLTFNLGLRYEMSTVPTSLHDKFVNLPTLTSPSTPAVLAAETAPPLFQNPTFRNFAPRVGLAWDPFGNGKTAVRAAFGIFDILPLTYNYFIQEGHPYPSTISPVESNLPAGSFLSEVAAVAPNWPSKVQSTNMIQSNPPASYLMNWNLNIEQQLTSSTSVMVGYVGSHGVHLTYHDDDADIVMPTITPQGYLWPSPRGSGTRLNPSFGDVTYTDDSASAFYDGLDVVVTKKMSRGLQVQGSFTWQKSIDTGSSPQAGNNFSNSIRGIPFWCLSCRKGLSDFNVGRIVKVFFLWEIPTPKVEGAILSHVLGGWQLGSIITAEDGPPVTPIMSGDPLGQNNAYPYDTPNRLTGPGCKTAVNPGNVAEYINLSCFADPSPLTLMGDSGRNSINGPGLFTWDASLYKNNYVPSISETFNVQFRVEMFNAFNRPNFGPPDDTNSLFNQSGNPVGGAGSLDTLATTPRQIQLALKVLW